MSDKDGKKINENDSETVDNASSADTEIPTDTDTDTDKSVDTVTDKVDNQNKDSDSSNSSNTDNHSDDKTIDSETSDDSVQPDEQINQEPASDETTDESDEKLATNNNNSDVDDGTLNADADDNEDSSSNAVDDKSSQTNHEDATIADNTDSDESHDTDDKKPKPKMNKAKKIAVIACVAGLALGGVCGYWLIPHFQSGELAGKSSLTTDEFSKVIATYNFKGHEYKITAAEVADYNGTDYGQDSSNSNTNSNDENENENSSNKNKTYDIPSTEDTVAAIRDKILTKEMDDRGIKATKKQIKKYAKENYGSDDFDSLAAQYSVDKKVVEKSIKRSVRVQELYKQVTGDYAPDRPNAPTSPSNTSDSSEYTKKTEDYGSYLMSIIKNDYDAKNNKWKVKKGDYYDALKGEDFDGKTASYSTCVKAYKIAYSKYSEKYDKQSKKWEDYTTDLYANTDVHFTNIMPSRNSN